jgi:hypothetical protein
MAAQIGEFMRQYQRRAQGGANEPNDRQYSRKFERKLKRLKPEEFDELLHGEEPELHDVQARKKPDGAPFVTTAIELDHIFVWASPGGEDEARALSEFGLSEGTPNTHPGQGTACRRFFFRNAYLELLWVTDLAEVQSAPIRPTHLLERWNARGTACPFGLCFRPGVQENCRTPFPSWEYRPPYLPESLSFHAGTNAGVLNEPVLFYLPFSRRPDSQSAPRTQALEHAAGLRELTRAELISPLGDNVSPAFEALLRTGIVRRREGATQLVELGFDGESKGQVADFRPRLPIVFCW